MLRAPHSVTEETRTQAHTGSRRSAHPGLLHTQKRSLNAQLSFKSVGALRLPFGLHISHHHRLHLPRSSEAAQSSFDCCVLARSVGRGALAIHHLRYPRTHHTHFAPGVFGLARTAHCLNLCVPPGSLFDRCAPPKKPNLSRITFCRCPPNHQRMSASTNHPLPFTRHFFFFPCEHTPFVIARAASARAP